MTQPLFLFDLLSDERDARRDDELGDVICRVVRDDVHGTVFAFSEVRAGQDEVRDEEEDEADEHDVQRHDVEVVHEGEEIGRAHV